MLNSQQNIMPYAYEMVNDLPTSMGINNANIPALSPNMLTPMNNKESFMPTQRNMQGSYAGGGLVPHYADGGQVGLEALLSQMGPEEIQELLMQHQMVGSQDNLPNWGQSDSQQLPHYKIGGIFKKIEKKVVRPVVKPIKKVALPVAGGIGGFLLGGPMGAAAGAGLGAKLAGGKNSTRNALLAAAAGFPLAVGYGALTGAGTSAIGGKLGSALSGMGKAGAGAAGLSKVAPALAPTVGSAGIGTGSIAAGLAGLGSGFADMLPVLGVAGTLLGKHKVPKEDLSGSVINAKKWGPESMPRKVKPLDRVQTILGPDEDGKYFVEINPETEYAAEGGYMHGHSGGQDDDIDARLSPGEYVLSADVVSRLGDGNNAAGAKRLDQFMSKVRMDTNSKRGKLSPKSKGIEAYLRRIS